MICECERGKRRTVRRTAKAANTAFAGGNGCGMRIKDKKGNEWLWAYYTNAFAKCSAIRKRVQDMDSGLE
jgi:hypothetical protein